MLKRLRWMSFGALLGAGAAAWTRRRLRHAAARGRPSSIGASVVARAARLGGDVRDAMAEGRAAMTARESELRAQLGAAPPARPADAARPALHLVEDTERPPDAPGSALRRWSRPGRRH